MTPEEKVALLKKAGVWDVIGFPSCIDKLVDLVAAHEREKLAEQKPVKLEHKTDGSPCWCNPELNYKDPKTGAEVWVHKEPQ